MTLAELIASARSVTCDAVATYLWSDAEWTEYANDAEREACRRARLIVDSSSSVCRITLDASHTTFALDPSILFIKRAKLSGEMQTLRRASFKDLDRGVPGWEDETGTPIAYVPDLDTDKFRPYPSPIAAGTVYLTVVRIPLSNMESDGDEPEINTRLHKSLVNWMLYRAYMKQDAEVFDEKKATGYLDTFEREFGKKSTAIDEAWLQHEADFTSEEGNF